MPNKTPLSHNRIVSLSFGIAVLLFAVGFYVSGAWSPPTLPPPANNVPAPLNAGPADQTKTGGMLQAFNLWVNSALGVTGGATFGGILDLQGNRITNVGVPTTTGDVATKGYVDAAAGGGGAFVACDTSTALVPPAPNCPPSWTAYTLLTEVRNCRTCSGLPRLWCYVPGVGSGIVYACYK